MLICACDPMLYYIALAIDVVLFSILQDIFGFISEDPRLKRLLVHLYASPPPNSHPPEREYYAIPNELKTSSSSLSLYPGAPFIPPPPTSPPTPSIPQVRNHPQRGAEDRQDHQ